MSSSKNKEVKVGILILLSACIMTIGYNFLKGNDLFKKHFTLYAHYPNIQGLAISNPVFINGLQVGTVKNITPEKTMKDILVAIQIKEDVSIPVNSIGTIIPNPLGNTKIDILLGNSNRFLKSGDSLQTMVNKGIVDDVLQRVDPVVFQVKKVTATLDSLLDNVNSAINEKTKNHISNSMSNMELLSNSLLTSSRALNKMLDLETGSVNRSLNNVEHITGNFEKQTGKINQVIDNMDQASAKLSQLDINSSLSSIQHAVATIDSTFHQINDRNGSLGLLLHDPGLYNSINATTYKLNTLLDDMRMHPKRYVSVSLFGRKKDKTTPLNAPLPDVTPPAKKP